MSLMVRYIYAWRMSENNVGGVIINVFGAICRVGIVAARLWAPREDAPTMDAIFNKGYKSPGTWSPGNRGRVRRLALGWSGS